MDLSKVFPPDVIEWLLKYGLFVAVCLFGGLAVLTLFRPFWMWYSGQSEANDRLRRLESDQRKVLFELEMLNKTLTIPLKKNAKKSAEPGPSANTETIPLDTSEFLRALEKSRKRIESTTD